MTERIQMPTYRLFSYNVNGYRASLKNGFMDWMQSTEIDVLGLQEIKVQPDQVGKEVHEPKGFKSAWNSAEKKGYSGVLTYYRKDLNPVVKKNMGVPEFDAEGRFLLTKFKEFTLINLYFPNGKKNDERLKYKMKFYKVFLELILQLRENGEKVVFCGDVNTAHKKQDLTNPGPNSKYSGFLPKERRWITKVIKNGFVDTLRHFEPRTKGLYTWWTGRIKGAKERNVGWRLDYFFIDEALLPNLKAAEIHRDVEFSDHCPVSITLEF